MKSDLFLCAVFIFSFSISRAQSPLNVNPDLLTKQWPASWISHPEANGKGYGVFHFRRSFRLAAKPTSFIIQVTADNRYRLFVNGRPVGFGPARGDRMHWQYETYDIAAQLDS